MLSISKFQLIFSLPSPATQSRHYNCGDSEYLLFFFLAIVLILARGWRFQNTTGTLHIHTYTTGSTTKGMNGVQVQRRKQAHGLTFLTTESSFSG